MIHPIKIFLKRLFKFEMWKMQRQERKAKIIGCKHVIELRIKTTKKRNITKC